MKERFVGVQIVPRPNETPDSFIKRFTRKVRESKVLEEYRSRLGYDKPSVKRRAKSAKARFEAARRSKAA